MRHRNLDSLRLNSIRDAARHESIHDMTPYYRQTEIWSGFPPISQSGEYMDTIALRHCPGLVWGCPVGAQKGATA